MNELALFDGVPVRKTAIPWANTMGTEEENAVVDVMRSGILSDFVAVKGEKFLGGSRVKKLEKAFCERFSAQYAITVNSATTALHTAIAACEIGPGDEVLVSPYTMTASASAILMNGAVPIFVDIDRERYTIDPLQIEKWITPNTKAILTVNIFGLPSDLPAIMKIARKHNLYVIEDNAQAPGATINGKEAGTIADIGVFSLNYHKVIHSGEGGVLLTNNKDLAYRCQLIRNHGEVILDESDDMDTVVLGNNYRMSEIHAAIGIEQLKKLDGFLETRRELAERLTQGLKFVKGLKGVFIPKGYTHSYYVYPIQFDSEIWGIDRKIFAKAIAAEGFPLGIGYVKPIYLMNMYKHKHVYNHTQYPFNLIKKSTQKYEKGICPVAENMHYNTLLVADVCRVPYTKDNIDEFLLAITKVWNNRKALKEYEKNCICRT
ncbi:DegT/DnrJ/EryC1/StrS family aminotransferase [Pectinatus frisingensis]|uniref:DegT/DnrJ/EryC1/StrS family aminotransferase n=1 Tax=Pectinatus frisingensis TaxID=865 RepID=UPI003D8067F5